LALPFSFLDIYTRIPSPRHLEDVVASDWRISSIVSSTLFGGSFVGDINSAIMVKSYWLRHGGHGSWVATSAR
jgi:hypothetical protein